MASAVVDFLSTLFPASVDPLPRERGFFAGPPPMLLEGTPDDAVVLLVGSDRSASGLEFGAHQAVLVRDQECKTRLPTALQGCLALTVLESKVRSPPALASGW